ncbi:AarF/ABC1/UbiB kinase family protein [Sporosarcina oncorhynchi]|uniref:AarF/ABC1/UbiB kinase family protein n=1 Tax=Sporosarcina oncorhynchi TaxID=3056444 RepID=A0ABZ0L5S9_9BACL|nr:AarF/ABC1/UbiB kinase family protein [Sporosarcina sp. T2O-4]WOV87500.1 AarF/ABC1/UbiB kinase family protein [Sporosarcina sp. T2O-4]
MYKINLRHTQRFQGIVNAFLKHGFGHILFRLGLTSQTTPKLEGNDMNMQDIGMRLRKTLQDLGPAFIKLGQVASSRRDLIPEQISLELAKLQDHVTPIPYDTVRDIVESELESTLEDLFAYFNKEPLAAASIGQVHVAELHTGEKVAIKVQRPGIRSTIEKDLAILRDLADYLEGNAEWAKSYRLIDMIDEFARSLKDELDYRIEARNCERIAKQFEEDITIHIPAIFPGLSTSKVLTMEMIDGIKVNDLMQLDTKGYDRKVLAARIANSLLHQMFVAGFFHGDPHPGNIYILPGNVVSYLDFGMVGRLSEDMKYHFASLVIHLRSGDTKALLKTFSAMEILSEDTDLRLFKRDIEDLQNRYYDIALTEVSLGEVFLELFQVAYRHHIQVPTEISMLGKAILTSEGLLTELDPDISIMKYVEPFGKQLLAERFAPKRLLEKSWDGMIENLEIISQLPKDLKSIATTIKKGKLQLDINVQQVQIFLNRLDRISNRLSLSIILLSFSILMVGLIVGASIAGQTNMLWNFPVLEIGSIVATLMFLYLIFSIFRSGRM